MMAGNTIRFPVKKPKVFFILKENSDRLLSVINHDPLFNFIKETAASNQNAFEEALSLLLNPAVAQMITTSVLLENWDAVDATSEKVRRAIPRAPLATKLLFPFSILRHHFRKHPGRIIMIIGPDGSGKTSLAEAIATRMYRKPFKGAQYCKGNFGLLPKIRNLRRIFSAKNENNRDEPTQEGEALSGMMRPLSAFSSLIIATYYALDLALECNAKQLGLFHLNQDRTDDKMDDIVEDCRRRIDARDADIDCFGVTGDMTFSL